MDFCLRKREDDKDGKIKIKRPLPNLEANYMYDYNETLDSLGNND